MKTKQCLFPPQSRTEARQQVESDLGEPVSEWGSDSTHSEPPLVHGQKLVESSVLVAK